MADPLADSSSEARNALARMARNHWKMFLFEGIVLVILGLLAVVVPPLASIAVTIVLGWLFLASGVAGLIGTFMARQSPGFWWSLFSAALAILAGGVLLARPLQGVLTLTFVLIAFFVFEGIASIMFAIEHKRELSDRWGWMLVAGLFDLAVAGIILAGLPGSAAWAIGLLVGINLVFGGTALIAMGLRAKPAA